MLTGFLITIQFLTALPIKRNLPMEKKYIEKAVQSFPILGLLQGILYSGILYSLMEWTPFSTLAIAFIVWLFSIMFTGGIHLDGWMDASDAYFSYQDKNKRLKVMSDPRTGAFGVLSILVLLSSRFLFLYEIIVHVHHFTYLLVFVLPFLSKGVMGMVLLKVPAAKKEGLAFYFQQACSRGTWKVYPLYLVLLLSCSTLAGISFVLFVTLLTIVALGCFVFIRKKSVQWFGGITGDILGATAEGTENVLWMTLWLLHYFVMG